MVQITGAGGDMDKIGLFVDVQNIYYTTRDTYQRTFDYRSFWQRLSKTGDLVIATAYATSRGDIGQQKFQAALRHIGFNVRLKPFVQRGDGSAKGDWDVGITLDIIEHAPKLDRVVLLSGDGDFDLLLDKVRAVYGAQVEVYGGGGFNGEGVNRCRRCVSPDRSVDVGLMRQHAYTRRRARTILPLTRP